MDRPAGDVKFSGQEDPHTALANAASARDLELVRLLIANGADPTVGYGTGRSAVECCLYGGAGRLDVAIELDKARLARLHPQTLIAAVDLQAPNLVRRALDIGADPNSRDASGIPALLIAADIGDTSVVDLLLSYGADPDAVKDDPSMMNGSSPLFAAVDLSAIDKAVALEIVRRLIAAGCNVNLPVFRGHDEVRPLDLAEKIGAGDIAQVLRDAGAVRTLEQPDPWGELRKD